MLVKSLAATLLTRGGATAALNMQGAEAAAAGAAAVVLKDFASTAGAYFGQVRTPASLVVGSSLSALFNFSRLKQDDLEAKSPLELTLLRIYLVTMLISYTLSLSTIIIASGASVTIIHGRFDAMAETSYQLLKREFDYEFTVTRWAFLVALLNFLTGITLKLVLEFKLLAKKRRNHLFAIVGIMTAVLTHLLSYINSTLYCWNNIFDMTWHVMELIYRHTFPKTGGVQPMQLISVAAGAIGVYFAGKIVLMRGLGVGDDDADEVELIKKND